MNTACHKIATTLNNKNPTRAHVLMLLPGRNVEILTHTDRPKPLPLLKEKNSNSKTSQATLTKPLTNISNMRLYKLAQQLQQRLMNRIVQ